MADAGAWTWRKSLLLLLLLLDLTAVAVWLAFNMETYQRLSTVVGGLWGGGMVVLAFLKVGVQRSSSFAEFFGLAPVRLVVGGYTGLIAGLLAFSGAVALPVHRVEVAGGDPGDGVSLELRVRLEDGEEVFGQQDPAGAWRFWLPVGNHRLVAQAEGFQPREADVRVNLYDFRLRREVQPLLPLMGRVEVVHRVPETMDYTLRAVSGEGFPLSGRFHEAVPGWDLEPGRYVLSARAAGFIADSFEVAVTARDTLRREIVLRERPAADPRGMLVLRSRPGELGIQLDGRPTGLFTPATLELRPGSYDVDLRGRSENAPDIGYQLRTRVTVTDGRETVVDTTLQAIRLARLVIFAGDHPGAAYYLDRVAPDTFLGRVSGVSTFFVFPGGYEVIREVDGRTEAVERIQVASGAEHVLSP